jgi:hypothetical protein
LIFRVDVQRSLSHEGKNLMFGRFRTELKVELTAHEKEKAT